MGRIIEYKHYKNHVHKQVITDVTFDEYKEYLEDLEVALGTYDANIDVSQYKVSNKCVGMLVHIYY